jgi:hypothetical protein
LRGPGVPMSSSRLGRYSWPRLEGSAASPPSSSLIRSTWPWIDGSRTRSQRPSTPPYTFLTDARPRQRRYKGLHELAYRDPRRLTPDAGMRSELGVRADEPCATVRFVSWSVGHDRGHAGFRREHQEEAVRRLGARLRVFVSSEGPIPPTLEQGALRLEHGTPGQCRPSGCRHVPATTPSASLLVRTLSPPGVSRSA